jgi:hypothetical protein
VKPVASVPVPPTVDTDTDTLPGTWALVVAVIFDGVTTVYDFAVVVPNLTEVAPVKWVPVMVTAVVPATGPEGGTTSEMIGAVTKVKIPVLATDPPVAVRATATVPPPWAGVLTVSTVGPVTWTVVPGVPPKVTLLVPARLVPVTVTDVPPATGPLDGVTEEIVGRVTKS